jgi:hypothetical protein
MAVDMLDLIGTAPVDPAEKSRRPAASSQLFGERLDSRSAHELTTNLHSANPSLVINLRTAVTAETMAKSATDEPHKAASKLDNHDATNENASTEKKHKSESKDKKKRKSSGDDEASKKKKRRHDENESADESSQKKKTKKRVSFGPGTKTKDADDSSDSDNDAGDEAEVDSTTAETSEKNEHEKALEEMKKRKREKKKERKSGAAVAATTTQVHETPILSYLNWYHRDRASWKFQKNRESNIFKHLYSLEHVPAAYNVALLVYLQGLKGEASKMRLSQGAAEVMSVDKEVEADEEYHQAVDGFREYLTAGSEDIGASDSAEQFEGETRKRLQRRQRAELVFFAVTAKLYIGQKPMPPQKQEPPQPKKRKNRTVVVDISSSSESDSDNEKSSSKKKAASKAKKADNNDDSTSSSGSSSDSDSDKAPPRKKAAKAKPAPPTPEPKKPEPPAPSKNKKKQKRKMRTALIEISSSESDSD